jgi:hypothetical protein
MLRSRVELEVRSLGADRCLVIRGSVEPERMAVLPTALAGRDAHLQSTAGHFAEADGDTLFVPRFPLIDGVSYSLLIDGVEAAAAVVPLTASTPTTRLTSIHPTAIEMPLNLLRIYITFSAPMSEGFAAGAIRARRVETGELLDDVFLPMDPELWDESRQRLTLLLDPGRIKRGLVPHAEAGYPLTEGEPIGISVDRSMRDAAGRPLRAGGGRVYKVGPANRARIDPNAWQISTPAAGSTDGLMVTFDRPLDHALLQRCLEVRYGKKAVAGGVAVDGGERIWRFEPTAPWQAGGHSLRVDTILEDVAGNSVRRVFDRELDLAEHAPLDTPHVDVPFVIS